MNAMRDFGALLFTLAIVMAPACKKDTPSETTKAAPPAAEPARVPPPISPPPAFEPAPGEVGPLGDDCYDAKQAKPCPPDGSDPSGHHLPIHGGACHFPICRPCGSETMLAFRDEHGTPSNGYCICVPRSDSSGRGSLSCYSKQAWKSRTK